MKTKDAFAVNLLLVHAYDYHFFERLGKGFYGVEYDDKIEKSFNSLVTNINSHVKPYPYIYDEDVLDIYVNEAMKALKEFDYARVNFIKDCMNQMLENIKAYKEKIRRHCERLDRYSKKWLEKISSDETLTAKQIRLKTLRVGKLSRNYYEVLGDVNYLGYLIKERIKKIENSSEKVTQGIFATRLREARIEAGYTQKDLATKLGMTQGGYTQYENVGREPTLSNLVYLARILNRSTDWLLGMT